MGPMGTLIRVNCSACRADLALVAGDITVTVCGKVRTWAYLCSHCGARTVHALTPDTLTKLNGAGVPVIHLTPPGQPLIAGEAPAGPPITEDDLLALGLELEALPNGGPER